MRTFLRLIPKLAVLAGIGASLHMSAAESVLHWPCDSLDVPDQTGNGLNGSASGDLAVSSNGKIDGSIAFLGSGSITSIPAANALNGLDAITVSCWINANQTNVDRGIFYGGTPNDTDALLGLRYAKHGWASGESNLIKASLQTDQGAIAVETSSYTQSTGWQHLALSWESGQDLQIYINGHMAVTSSSTLDNGIDFNEHTIIGFGGNQDAGGNASIEDDGSTLAMSGNTWKAIEHPYTVTADTVLSFEFKSSIEGEIHGIGLDNNTGISPENTFRVHGTQGWGRSEYNNYTPDGWQVYKIPIGQFYTGSFQYLFFVNDHDSGSQNGESRFRNVQITESPNDKSTAIAGTIAGIEKLIVGAGAKGQSWDGRIDDFRIFSEKLTPQAIRKLATPSELLYSEPFTMAEGGTFIRPLTASFGWHSQAWYQDPNLMAAEHGDRVTGSASTPAINSAPIAAPTQDGALYTSNTSHSILTYTREHQGLDISQVRDIRFNVSAKAGTPIYLAIEIAGQWYVSESAHTVVSEDLLTIGSGPEAFETAAFTIDETLFTDLIVWDTGIIKRGSSDGHQLPGNGQVTAFGIFTGKNGSNKYVIDDYQIFGSPVADLGSFAISIPPTSKVSPLFIEGDRTSSQSLACTADGNQVQVLSLSNQHFFADIPLNSSAPASVSISADSTSLTRSITWEPTLVESDPGMTIRAGDALLLKFPHPVGSFGLLNACGPSQTIDLTNTTDTVVYTFDSPGVFSVTFTEPTGDLITGVQIGVVGVTSPNGRACEFAYSRFLPDVTIAPEDLSDAVTTWSPKVGANADIYQDGPDGYRLTPLVTNDITIAHRIGTDGPIICTEQIEVFELRTTAEQILAVWENFDDGTIRVGATMRVIPPTNELDCRVTVIAAGVTMDDSTLERSYPSNDFTITGNEAQQKYSLLMDPTTFSGGPCHRISAWQQNIQVGGE